MPGREVFGEDPVAESCEANSLHQEMTAVGFPVSMIMSSPSQAHDPPRLQPRETPKRDRQVHGTRPALVPFASLADQRTGLVGESEVSLLKLRSA